jgi:hypothetical protein
MLRVRCCAVSTATCVVTETTAQSSYSDRPKPKTKSTLPRMTQLLK